MSKSITTERICIQCGGQLSLRFACGQLRPPGAKTCSVECGRKHRWAWDKDEEGGFPSFWTKVGRQSDCGACWPWLAGTSKSGYGITVFRGSHSRAHRVA